MKMKEKYRILLKSALEAGSCRGNICSNEDLFGLYRKYLRMQLACRLTLKSKCRFLAEEAAESWEEVAKYYINRK